MLLHFVDELDGVDGPGEILRDMDAEKLEDGDTLNLSPINVVGRI